MGILDKIKNALFEVEYVEVEEKPKKEKKSSNEDVEVETSNDTPIAKKIILPGNKEDKIEELHEVELEDEDFEIRPKDENFQDVFKDNYNVMGDDDFYTPEEPQVVPNNEVEPEVLEENNHPVQDYVTPVQTDYVEKDYVREYDSYKEKVNSTLHDEYHIKTRESRPYGMDPSYQISIKEYGTESREERVYFKPSPIISPIYGILDKNYKKEDVVAKKEIRLTSSYVRTNVNVDDIRNKAYGRKSEVTANIELPTTPKTNPKPSFEVQEEDDENLLVDLSDEKKPEVKEITVGDAIEYYQDLGLEYNVDYVDASNKNAPKPKPDDLEEDIKDNMSSESVEEVKETEKEEIEEQVVDTSSLDNTNDTLEEKNMETPIVEEKEESSKDDSTLDEDDNLFDLIDSMYRDEDN